MNKFFAHICLVVVMLGTVAPAQAIRTQSRIVVDTNKTMQTVAVPCVTETRTYIPCCYEPEVAEETTLFWRNFYKVAGGVLGFCFGGWVAGSVCRILNA
jgi:hypothetical protein